MGRVINTEKISTDRNRMMKFVALALREMAKQNEIGDETRDMAAFIAMTLDSVFKTIETSVTAWEKRDYWVKADKFRMEWAWTGRAADGMKDALMANDWGRVALISASIAQRLNKITLPSEHRMGRPWVGALNELRKR